MRTQARPSRGLLTLGNAEFEMSGEKRAHHIQWPVRDHMTRIILMNPSLYYKGFPLYFVRRNWAPIMEFDDRILSTDLKGEQMNMSFHSCSLNLRHATKCQLNVMRTNAPPIIQGVQEHMPEVCDVHEVF